MKRELRTVQTAADRARAELENRDHAIVTAWHAGHSLRAIAEVAGLSHAAIAGIVQRHHYPDEPRRDTVQAVRAKVRARAMGADHE